MPHVTEMSRAYRATERASEREKREKSSLLVLLCGPAAAAEMLSRRVLRSLLRGNEGRQKPPPLLSGHGGSAMHPQRSLYLRRPSSSSSSSSSSSKTIAEPPRPFFARFYLRMLEKRPVLTKSITAATIYFFADTTSQSISKWQSEEPEEVRWDVKRTVRMFAAGLFISGPSLHFWFNFVSRHVPKRDLVSTLKKMAMGQLIYGPIFTVVFFSLNAFVQGESVDEIISRLRRDFFRTIKSGLLYWPACDFVTYRYVPVQLQPLVSNSFSFLWTIYFTYMACLKKVEIVECRE